MPMRYLAVAARVAGTMALAGCAQRSAQPDVPAVLTNPATESRAELVRVVSEAMNALGIPTTRALMAATTGEKVYRETVLPGAIERLADCVNELRRAGNPVPASQWRRA